MTRHGIMRRFARAEDGAVLVEFAILMPLLLLLVFGLIDFGRLGFSVVMAQKATEMAVRDAVVRREICGLLPTTHARGTVTGTLSGSSCASGPGVCAAGATLTCSAADSPAFWARVATLMPTNARPENLKVHYAFNPALGFLGGPYTPYVTVEITDLDFEFVTPLGALARLSGVSDPGTLGDAIAFPSMSASLPAEALRKGDDT